MSDQPSCDLCGEPGLYRCHGIIADGLAVRGCGKRVCGGHIAGTAKFHFNPGGVKTVAFCAPCWEERLRTIEKRKAEMAARAEREETG